MYLELTPEDTLRDLQTLLIDAIPGFEFPRVNLEDYETDVVVVSKDEISEGDFVLGPSWDDTDDLSNPQSFCVDNSHFNIDLTTEEINILALLMKTAWVQRQVTSIENTRMKYSGADFKMTSQANHLSKLLSLLTESQRDSFHMQRLYKRRKKAEDGTYQSNWSVLIEKSALE